jgi:anaerobic dimethyl sulfoxide reductase subunit B (iron-sulfur subunit)
MNRVLDIGPIDQLRAGTYQTKAVGPADQVVGQVKNMASPELTHPSIVFIPHPQGRVEVPVAAPATASSGAEGTAAASAATKAAS